MGVLFSNNEGHSVIARYENGIVYSLGGDRVLGRYGDGYIFSTGDRPIALYGEEKVYGIEKEEYILHAKQGCVMRNDTVLAKYQGGTEGACAAAFLVYEEKLTGKRSSDTYRPPRNCHQEDFDEDNNDMLDENACGISLVELWSIFDEKCPGFLKVVITLILLSSIYFLYQFPATVALLLESEAVGVIMLVLWGGAFLIGLRKCWDTRIKDFSAFLRLLWRVLIPYIYVSAAMIVLTCVNAAYHGYFSSSYLSSALMLFPPAAFYLTLPLFALQLIRVLYVLHKQNI